MLPLITTHKINKVNYSREIGEDNPLVVILKIQQLVLVLNLEIKGDQIQDPDSMDRTQDIKIPVNTNSNLISTISNNQNNNNCHLNYVGSSVRVIDVMCLNPNNTQLIPIK